MGALTLVSAARSVGDRGRAQVIGPVPGTEQLRVEVLDGPDPRTWLVSGGPYGDPAPGEVIDVRLAGSCRCEPHPVRGSAITSAALGAVLLALAALGYRSWSRTRRAHANQVAAARCLHPDAPVLAVRLTPSLRARKHRVSVRVAVTDLEGAAVGEVDLGGVHGAFDPHGPWWLVGETWLGSSVALVSSGRRQVVLPSSPLQAVSEVPTWSATAVALLGWSDPGPRAREVPVLPSHGRVGVGSVSGSEAAGSEAVDRLWAAGTAARRSAGRQVSAGFVVLLLLGLFGGRLGVSPLLLIGAGAVAVVAVNAGFRRRLGSLTRQHLDLSAADEPFALDIGAAVVAWHHPEQPAPAFASPLPTAAT